MAAPPTEQRELQLVDNVEFKILAVANNEEKLQQLLSRFLPPLLLKAASEHASVRSKVFILLHVPHCMYWHGRLTGVISH
jgi:proteasome component ECM29